MISPLSLSGVFSSLQDKPHIPWERFLHSACGYVHTQMPGVPRWKFSVSVYVCVAPFLIPPPPCGVFASGIFLRRGEEFLPALQFLLDSCGSSRPVRHSLVFSLSLFLSFSYTHTYNLSKIFRPDMCAPWKMACESWNKRSTLFFNVGEHQRLCFCRGHWKQTFSNDMLRCVCLCVVDRREGGGG